MPAIMYCVTATLPDEPTAERYLTWLASGHVQEVCQVGRATAQVIRIQTNPPQIASVYTFASQTDLDRYERDFAPKLRAEGAALFPPESGIRFTREYATIVLAIPAQRE